MHFVSPHSPHLMCESCVRVADRETIGTQEVSSTALRVLLHLIERPARWRTKLEFLKGHGDRGLRGRILIRTIVFKGNKQHFIFLLQLILLGLLLIVISFE